MSGNVAEKDMIRVKGVKLTPKRKAFADTLIANPKMSPTQSALLNYGKPDKPTTYGTAKSIAHTNLSNPNVQIYLDKHVSKAKQRITELLDSENEQIVLASSKDILDRTFGKAAQKTENQSVAYIEHVTNKRNVYNL